jgi:hypothetical protein
MTETELEIAGNRKPLTEENLIRVIQEHCKPVADVFREAVSILTPATQFADAAVVRSIVWQFPNGVPSGLFAAAVTTEWLRVKDWIARSPDITALAEDLRNEVLTRNDYYPSSTDSVKNMENMARFAASQHVLQVLTLRDKSKV